MRIANGDRHPRLLHLRADHAELAYLVVVEHALLGLEEVQMQVDGGGRAQLERVENAHAALGPPLKHEARPLGELSLADVCPPGAEIRAREVDEMLDR
jgi:hypothetical protein